MQVILLQDIKKIGKKGDLVKVKDGFATNYLLPNKLAIPNKGDLALKIQQKNSQKIIKKDQDNLELVQKLYNLSSNTINIKKPINPKGKYFAPIKAEEIWQKFNLKQPMPKWFEFVKIEKPGSYSQKFDICSKCFIIKLIAQ